MVSHGFGAGGSPHRSKTHEKAEVACQHHAASFRGAGCDDEHRALNMRVGFSRTHFSKRQAQAPNAHVWKDSEQRTRLEGRGANHDLSSIGSEPCGPRARG